MPANPGSFRIPTYSTELSVGCCLALCLETDNRVSALSRVTVGLTPLPDFDSVSQRYNDLPRKQASQIPARFRRFFTSQITRNLENLARNLALLLSEGIFHKGKFLSARFSSSDLGGISGI